MALHPDDPWYMRPPDSRSDAEGNRRYKRALALSEMRQFIARIEKLPTDRQQRFGQAVAYRRHCLENWQDYLAGKILPPTGRKPRS